MNNVLLVRTCIDSVTIRDPTTGSVVVVEPPTVPTTRIPAAQIPLEYLCPVGTESTLKRKRPQSSNGKRGEDYWIEYSINDLKLKNVFSDREEIVPNAVDTDSTWTIKVQTLYEKLRAIRTTPPFPSSATMLPYQNDFQNLVSPPSPFRRMLMFHDLGSGKTLSSLCAYAPYYYLQGYGVTVIAPPALLPNFEQEVETKSQIGMCFDLDPKQEDRFRYITPIRLWNRYREYPDQTVDLYFRNRVVIVDEVHKLVTVQLRDDVTDMRENDFKLNFQIMLKKHGNVIPLLLLMTGTPSNNDPSETAQIFNMMQSRFDPDQNQYLIGQDMPLGDDKLLPAEKFGAMWRGYVSRVTVHPERKPIIKKQLIEIDMTQEQQQRYQQLLDKIPIQKRNFITEPDPNDPTQAKVTEQLLEEIAKDNYMTQSRQICCIGVLDAETAKEFDVTRYDQVSNKFPRIKKIVGENKSQVRGCRGTVLVYCYFRNVLKMFQDYLVKSGYVEYNPFRISDPAKTFIVLTGTNSKDAQQAVNVVNGGLASIFLMTEVGAEGLNFNHCVHVVFMTPTWTPTTLDQIIGRCDRISSKLVQQRDLFVQVSVILSKWIGTGDMQTSKRLTADQRIYSRMIKKRTLMKQYYNEMEKASFFCPTNCTSP